jgi:rhodanese-related sulfurtransferase
MKLTFFKSAIIVALLLFCGAVFSNALADDGFRTIDTLELQNWMNTASPPMLIYSLSQVEFEEQRIPGSICIPMELMQASSDMPPDKGHPLVFYCHGPG